MNAVRLDDLVLQCCAAHMDIGNRLTKERVSRRFANALQLVNATTEVSLTAKDKIIEAKNALPYPTVTHYFHIVVNGGPRVADWNAMIPIKTQIQLGVWRVHWIMPCIENSSSGERMLIPTFIIRRVLLAIFSRFAIFKCLDFTPCSPLVRSAMDGMMKIFKEEGYSPSTVKQLIYSAAKDSRNNEFKITKLDCNLIELLSSSIEELILLVGDLPYEMQRDKTGLAKRFWIVVSECSGLKILCFCRNFRDYLYLNMDMSKCLKSLKQLRAFHVFRSNQRKLNASWFVESFSNNRNLRKLYINHCGGDLIEPLSTPSVLEIIERLRSVEISIDTYDFDEFVNTKTTNIRMIVYALPEKGYARVDHHLNIQSITVNGDDSIEALLKALYFWMTISEEMRRSIKLFVHATDSVVKKHVTLTRQDVDNIEKEGLLAGAKFEHLANCTILQLNNAKFVIYYNYTQYVQKYIAAEHIGRRYLQ